MRQIRSTRIRSTRHRPAHPERPVKVAEALAAFTGDIASLMDEVAQLDAAIDAVLDEQLTRRHLA